MQQSYWIAPNSSASQEIPQNLWNLKAHYQVTSLTFVHILGQTNPVHALISILPSRLYSTSSIWYPSLRFAHHTPNTLLWRKLWFSYEHLACKQMFRLYVTCNYRCLDCMSLEGTDVWTACHLKVQMYGPHITCKYRCLDCTPFVGTDVWTACHL